MLSDIAEEQSYCEQRNWIYLAWHRLASCVVVIASMLQSNRQTGAQTPERVTVIVQKPPSKEDGKPLPAEASADVPVPASAFASLKSGVNSAKSEADMSPFSTAALPPKDPSGESAGTESDEQLDHQVPPSPSTLLWIIYSVQAHSRAGLHSPHSPELETCPWQQLPTVKDPYPALKSCKLNPF